jgi:hypothetical protein
VLRRGSNPAQRSGNFHQNTLSRRALRPFRRRQAINEFQGATGSWTRPFPAASTSRRRGPIAKLPSSPRSNQTGRHGVTVLQDRLESKGWLFRRQDGDTDFGVDAELEVVRRDSVTGRLVKCQVKTSDSIEFRDGVASVQVSVSTHNLWRAMPLLTILFYVERSSRAIYWTPALAHQPRPAADSLLIRFDEGSDISADMSSLETYLDSWFAARSPDAILSEIAPMNRIYEELKSHVDHLDAWSEVWDETEDRFVLFYNYVQRLRLEVGLSNQGIPSIADWRMRSEGVWQGAYPLFFGTFDEAMHMIIPAYEEALDRIVQRLRGIELTVENQEVWNFVEQRTKGHQGRYLMTDSRSSSPNFHRKIEKRLQELSSLKYPWQPRNNGR